MIDKIQKLLVNREFVPSPYREKIVYEGSRHKKRNILVPKFCPDQIVQWAVLLQIIPALSRGIDPFCCGSVPGRGRDYAHRYLQRWLKRDPKGTKYCLKMDVHHFYPSVDHDTLKAMLRRKLKDPALLHLLDLIIDSAPGLPIGNVTSQWLANFYLQGMDHYLREQLHVKYYVRNMDDMVILGSNKRRLGKIREAVEEYLKGLKLQLNPSWQKFKVDSRGIDFLGYRFYHNKTILRRAVMLKITRKVKRTAKKKSWNPHNCKSILSSIGWFRHTNNYGCYQKWVKPYINVKKMKGVVSNEDRKRNHAASPV